MKRRLFWSAVGFAYLWNSGFLGLSELRANEFLTSRQKPSPLPSPIVEPSPPSLTSPIVGPSPKFLLDQPNVYDIKSLVGRASFSNFVDKADDLGSRIPNLIYNQISHFGVNLLSTSNFSLNMNFGRDVYDNKSVLGTWTVVDQIGFSAGIPLFNFSTVLPGIMNSLSFSIGTDVGIVVTDIKQVSPPGYAQLPTIFEVVKKAKEDANYQSLLKTSQLNLGRSFEEMKGQWVHFENELGKRITSFLPADAEFQARYVKIWNMFLTPFRLPLTKSRVLGMDDDEIISYEGQGAIQSSLGTGFSVDPIGLTSALSAGLSVSVFSRGIFRISILKETGSIVKVKITKTGSTGGGWSAGFSTYPGIMDQFVIIRNLANLIKIIPFQLSQGANQARSFELTYQYDLATQSGAHAYENAVLGNLKPSDELAINPSGDWRTLLTETGVLRLSEYQSKSQTTSVSDQMQLAFIFRQSQSGQVIDTEGVLKSSDGTQRRLTALAQNTKEWGLIFSQFQKYQHNFVVNLDLDQCERDPDSCKKFPMQIEGRIDDSDTTQSALLHYILEVEDSVGQPDLFSRTPEIRDLRDFAHDPYHPFYFYHPGHDLGGSHFYYSINLNPDQVEEVINYPEAQMWQALERAFYIPSGAWKSASDRWLYAISRAPVSFADLFLNLFQFNWAPGTNLFHAESIYRRWNHLKSFSRPIEKAEALAKFFLEPLYSKNMTRLVRGIIAGESVDYYASGSNRVIGSVSRHGGAQLGFEDLASQLARTFELKKAPTPEELDPTLQVADLCVHEAEGGEIKLEINTPIAPDSYYVDLTINDWSSFMIKNKLIFAKVFKNQGISAGRSSISLNPSDFLSEWGDLARHLKPNIRYVLRVATSKDGQKWGRVSQTEFRLLKF
jgi:hypothetical protein